MKKKLLTLFLVAIILSLVLSLTACNTYDPKVIRLSTTTSVNDSGLMDYLMPHFKADTGYTVEIASAGTGAAINAAKYGNADIILVHSKAAEEAFVDEGYALKLEGRAAERLPFMYNFFILVGPNDDPAGAKDTATIQDAFAAIAEGGYSFVSRGDKSGTHNKEVTLWDSELGITGETEDQPEGMEWYMSAGSGMGACLTMANEESAYILTDKATFLSYKNDSAGDKLSNLKLLYEEDDSLKNTYSILAVDPDAPFVDAITGNPLEKGKVEINTKGAKAFADWMLSAKAKGLIAEYGKDKYGEALFTYSYVLD